MDIYEYGCLPFTSKTHLVSNCANERKNFDWKIPFGARAFHFIGKKRKYIVRPGAKAGERGGQGGGEIPGARTGLGGPKF